VGRVHNFAAGPAALPEAVLARIREDLPEYRGCGMSVMEMSHRGAGFRAIAEAAEARLRALLAIPEDYRVLFLQGGASLQFSAVALNLSEAGQVVDYLDTGYWSGRAIAEARRFCEVNVVASGAPGGYRAVPAREGWRLTPGAAYLHCTPNETIGGVELHQVPEVGATPLVADMSSTLLSRPLEVGRFALIYAGAQKNLGIAGLTVVIVRAGLLGRARAITPRLLDYRVQAEAGSLANTAPTFAWYVAGLLFEWIAEQGGLAALGERNRRKAERLYVAIDASALYHNGVEPGARSWMNVPFTLAEPALEAAFLAAAREAGLVGLEGHRSTGGLRASLYNAVPEAAVEALVAFMGEFERLH